MLKHTDTDKITYDQLKEKKEISDADLHAFCLLLKKIQNSRVTDIFIFHFGRHFFPEI